MTFHLCFLDEAKTQLEALRKSADKAKRYKAVLKCLGYLEANPRHPGLRTHKFLSKHGPAGEEVFEAYAENQTSAAYRVFWCYGRERGEITVIAITPHP